MVNESIIDSGVRISQLEVRQVVMALQHRLNSIWNHKLSCLLVHERHSKEVNEIVNYHFTDL